MKTERMGISNLDEDTLDTLMKEKSLGQLLTISDRLWSRIKVLQRVGYNKVAIQFTVGDRVSWDKGHITYSGVVSTVNRKTLSILADDNRKWRVGFSLARKFTLLKDVKEGSANKMLRFLRISEKVR